MTFDPARRRDNVAGACARRKAADLHEGTREDFLRRHEREAAEAAHGNKEAKKKFVAKLLPRTADSRNLRPAWDYLAHGDGQAAGLRFNDLDDAEVWNLVRVLRDAVLNDAYRPGRDRIKAIPKANGKGVRTLSIPSVIDRVVQRAIVQTTQPYLDQFFDDNSFGYRPNSHVYHALAAAEKLTVENGAWVWLTEDLKDAFNQASAKAPARCHPRLHP
jgi:retron-type reverse transcriptase